MGSKRDLRVPSGAICAQAFHAIQSSSLFRALSRVWGDVEVWAVVNAPTDEFSYFWLVSLQGEVVRELACVRYSCRRGLLQERIQGPFRQVYWETVGPSTGPLEPAPQGTVMGSS
jgi:hypothetical protein